jgi:hypothetical protein
MFADPDYFLFAGAPNCTSPCVTVPTTPPTFAWNHGSIEPEIATTWVGLVGPGVRNLGQDDKTWLDHTDLRPTILGLLGLQDDYGHDGRVVAEPLYAWALPKTVLAHRETWLRLAAAYKQLNAPFGEFGMATLKISTQAINSTDEAAYEDQEAAIADWTAERDALASQIKALLTNSTFNGQPINEQQAKSLTRQAQLLIDEVVAAAS